MISRPTLHSKAPWLVLLSLLPFFGSLWCQCAYAFSPVPQGNRHLTISLRPKTFSTFRRIQSSRTTRRESQLFSLGNENNDNGDDPNDPRALRRRVRSSRDRQRQLKNKNNDQRINGIRQYNNNNYKKKPSKFATTTRKAKQAPSLAMQQAKQSSYRRAKRRLEIERAASAAFDLPKLPPVKTISGGSNMIFAMAHQMFQQDTGGGLRNDSNNNNKNELDNRNTGLFPRWRPTPTQTVGISNVNPDFRTQAPEMNHQGYAGTIWRNVRKRQKPSLWKYALRTYERMASNHTTTVTESETNGIVERTNVHHQGALLAAAKLGLWEKALEIYRHVECRQEELLSKQSGNIKNQKNNNNKKVKDDLRWRLATHVTDDMVISLVYACVRASRSMSSTDASLDERRRPLDVARRVLHEAKVRHGIPTQDTRHYNPLAAAYQRLRLRNEAEALLSHLNNRQIGPEPETGQQRLNVHDLTHTKDKGSYTLLVSGAVQEEDWVGAVDALRNMTDAGLYPTQRHLNAWTEVSERKTKHRTTRSWKKKRDELWIERGLR